MKNITYKNMYILLLIRVLLFGVLVVYSAWQGHTVQIFVALGHVWTSVICLFILLEKVR